MWSLVTDSIIKNLPIKKVLLSLSTPLRSIGETDVRRHSFFLTRLYIEVGGKRHNAAAFLLVKIPVPM